MALLLALPLVFYSANAKHSRDHTWFDRGIVIVSSPIQSAVTATIGGISDAWYGYVALVDVEKDNGRLLAQNRRLRREVARLQEYAVENERLRGLLRFSERAPEVRMVAADVIAVSASPLSRIVQVNRGSGDGIELGSAVVHDDGAVGRVVAVADTTSDVILLADVNHSTDVVFQRTRVRARVRGRGRDGTAGVKIEHLARTAPVELGDLVVTSGLGNVFPKGIPVGTVREVIKTSHGPYQPALLEPSVDFGRLESVLIIQGDWPPETDYQVEAHAAKRWSP